MQILQWIQGAGGHRTVRMWQLGDYAAVARFLVSAGEACVRDARVGPGDDVLDVACGTGNATIPAARAGARVTGLDITPELLDIGAGLAPEVAWVEGDAQELPFADDSFDVVMSVFGCMFAPDQARAARELQRVLRPGGRLVVSSWTPEGNAGALLALVGSYLGANGDPPTRWGTEDGVRALLGEVSCARDVVRFEFASVAAAVDFYATAFGPMIAAREALGERWADLRAELHHLFASHDLGRNGAFAYEGEYLTAQAT